MYPILFRFNSLNIYAYGFFIALGFVSGLVLAIPRTRKEGIPFDRVIDLFFYTVLSAVLGSRALFVLINFDTYRESPLQMFKLWEGGLGFYVGALSSTSVTVGL